MNIKIRTHNFIYSLTKPYKKLRNRFLAKRYPWLLPYSVWSGKLRDDYDYSYLWAEPEKGWNRVIFYPMMEEIRVAAKEDGIIDRLRTADYKSKYGGLRFYIEGGNDKIHNIIHRYETLTENICEICGEPDVGSTSGWITPICKKCYTKNKWHSEPYDEAISEDRRMTDWYEYIKYDEKDEKVHYKIDVRPTANKIRKKWNIKHPFRRKQYAKY